MTCLCFLDPALCRNACGSAQRRNACEEVGMKNITIQAFAKVNLCLDVKGLMEGGYHEIAMILQQIHLHDDVRIEWNEQKDPNRYVDVELGSSRDDIPLDETNLAWKAALEMAKVRGDGPAGKLKLWIEKRIPMAAGLAGGSSDCAAVIHGLNVLWELGLSLEELCQVGARLGSDVPFCIMGQAAADPVLKERFENDENAAHCAIATGRGTDLQPIMGLKRHMVLARPDIDVSTGEVYNGIDGMTIDRRPDIEEMRDAIMKNNAEGIEKNMVNVLELFTLKRYPVVVYTKDKVQDLCKGPVLMSGSGPTIYCLCRNEEEACGIFRQLEAAGIESYRTMTTF